MKKIHWIISLTFLALTIISGITFAIWQPCVYAWILTAIIAAIGLVYFVVAFSVSKMKYKNANKQHLQPIL